MTKLGRLRSLLLVAMAVAAGGLMGWSSQAGAQGEDCSGWNPPNTLVLAAGSPQQTQVGKPFETTLQVMLANTDGCPLTGSWAGVSVVFTAPATGASGTFASSDSSVAVVGTDAAGVATAPTFTAEDTAGSYSVQAASSYGTVTLYLTNTATGVAASIAVAGNTDQSATVGSQYRQPLRAQVLDANGQPVQRVTIDFVLGTGTGGAGAGFLGGGGGQSTAVTDANGIATSPGFVANGNRGRFNATAATENVATAVTYRLRNLAPGLTAATKTETATVDRRYRRPLQVRVLGKGGRPVEGITVTFTLPQSAARAGAIFLDGTSQATEPSDSSGRANSPPLEANSTAGSFTATATATATAGVSGSKPIGFRLTNLAGIPATIVAGAADGESAPTGSRFPIRLAVTVTDKNGNPVPGVLVTFTAPARGPSGHFTIGNRRVSRIVRARTAGNGVAIAPAFTADNHSGGYVVTVRAAGERAAFALVNSRR